LQLGRSFYCCDGIKNGSLLRSVYEVSVIFAGINFIPNVMNILHFVQKLRADAHKILVGKCEMKRTYVRLRYK